MNTRTRLLALAAMTSFALPPLLAGEGDKAKTEPAKGAETAQDVIFLTDARPLFLRVRLDAGGKGFREAWLESLKDRAKYLDRDGDGVVTKQEAKKSALPDMVRAATGGAAALPSTEYDTDKDGKVSLDELADALRPALGPFRVQVGRQATERTDALFNHIDRDKDGKLTKEEMDSATPSLMRFDLDDDELVDPLELEPFSNPIAMQMEEPAARRTRFATVQPVIELSHDDPSMKPVRLLIKRYDKGTAEGAAAGDNRLTRGELGIDEKPFAAADMDGDGALDIEELRRFLAQVEPDLELAVKLDAAAKSPASIEVSGADAKSLPPGVKVERHSGGDLEIAVGAIHLEFRVDGGENAAENAKNYYAQQFQALDKDNNKYLEKSEVADSHGPISKELFEQLDRDGDGKVYMKDVEAFVDEETKLARSQVVLSAADQGRAIFAIVDLNRDRHLGAREIRGAVDRITSWDQNGDGMVSADEIPHHYQLTIGRGQATPGGAMAARSGMMAQADEAAKQPPGPKWFVKMDRNRDGDVSRREFLGTRSEFERIDHDRDGLITADEAGKPKG
jgi:Ca2+-binding EF-hand superfamily protein